MKRGRKLNKFGKKIFALEICVYMSLVGLYVATKLISGELFVLFGILFCIFFYKMVNASVCERMSGNGKSVYEDEED